MINLDRNFLRSKGEVPPSSEALTHAALYQSRSSIRAVVRVHYFFRVYLNTDAFGLPELVHASSW